jgi:peptidoglycan lytic transglycosylase G
VVERRPGVMPPKPGPPPRQPVPRRTILLRRFIALGALLVVGLIAAVTIVVGRGGESAAPTVTAVPPPKPFHIIFPEGFTRREMAHRVDVVAQIAESKSRKQVKISSRGYLHWSQPRAVAGFGSKKRSLEGFLFPATYDFLRNTTSRRLVESQLEAFNRNWRKVDLRYAKSKNLTPYDVLIIASLVEKETLAPDERPLVAAVIYNRLKAGMNLGIDATTRYGLNVPGTEPLRESQLQSDNPYNTRNPNITGLTPTPIANPGLASMQAAAHPRKVPYLYFVRKPDKVHHYFTDDFQDFQNHLIQYGYR